MTYCAGLVLVKTLIVIGILRQGVQVGFLLIEELALFCDFSLEHFDLSGFRLDQSVQPSFLVDEVFIVEDLFR